MGKYINIERLEIIVNYKCNSNCKHCLIMPHQYNDETLDPTMAQEITENICQKYNPFSIMCFGGEPTLSLETTKKILQVAKKYQIPHRQILTNGFWGKDSQDESIYIIANSILDSGANSIHISLDSFHNEYIPLDVQMKTAEILNEKKIQDLRFSPRWIINRNNNNLYNKKTQDLIDKVKERRFLVDKGDYIQLRGNAMKNLSNYFKEIAIDDFPSCREIRGGRGIDNIRSICISPVGDVIICNNIIIGNVFQTPIIDILENYNPHDYPDLKIILEKGVPALLDLAKSNNIELKMRKYYSVCDACLHWRSQLGFTKYCKS